MRWLANLATLCAVLLLVSSAAQADGRIGLVLLHGKTGMPWQMTKLSEALTAAGYLVSTPEMCWSKKRIFDKALPDCLAEVDAAIDQLKAKGASAIIVGGTSQGGVAAFDYAANHSGLAGVIAMAPAADPLEPAKYPALMQSLARARNLVAEGQGDIPTDIADLTSGKMITVHATPNNFLSFHGATSPIGTVRGMEDTVFPRLTVPLLWVAGSSDPTQKIGPQAFTYVPKNPRNRYVSVGADHVGTPDASVDAVLDWLKALQ